jgi:hypothetical protein
VEIDKLDPEVPWWGGVIALAIAVGFFVLFDKVSAKNKTQIAFQEQDLLENANMYQPFPENKNI